MLSNPIGQVVVGFCVLVLGLLALVALICLFFALRAARRKAGLTQAQLAERLDRSQALVSLAERGALRTGTPYLHAVLEACGLPVDWEP